MYVRNYGLPPRNVKRDGEPSLTRATVTEELTAEQNGTEYTESVPENIPEPLPHKKEETASEENAQKFGEHGIPPQRPLRRRVIKRKPKEELPQILDQPAPEGIPQKTDREKTGESTVSTAPTRNECNKTADHRFNTEDLFLGSLLILLVGDHADDDILIMLAFLLFSGFKFK